MIKYVSTDSAPKPAGHYSQAIVHNGVVYVAGQLPIDPETGEKVFGAIGTQTERALKNIEAILKASGSDREHVLKATLYVADIAQWGAVNTVFAAFFGEHKPARVVVPVHQLHFGFAIEVDVCAAVIDADSEEI